MTACSQDFHAFPPSSDTPLIDNGDRSSHELSRRPLSHELSHAQVVDEWCIAQIVLHVCVCVCVRVPSF